MMIDLAFGIVLVAMGAVIGRALTLTHRDQDRDDALVRYRVALSTARARAHVIAAMIQDEDYVTAQRYAESMYNLGESE